MDSNFPEEMNLVIVDDLFLHYDLGFDDEKKHVHVYCDRCEEIVCDFPYDNAKDTGELVLYEYIIDSHKEIE